MAIVVDAVEILRQISGLSELNDYHERRKKKNNFNWITLLIGNTDHSQLCFVVLFKKTVSISHNTAVETWLTLKKINQHLKTNWPWEFNIAVA